MTHPTKKTKKEKPQVVDFKKPQTEFSMPHPTEETKEIKGMHLRNFRRGYQRGHADGRQELLTELESRIKAVKRDVAKTNGTFKYDSCYDDCLEIVASYQTKPLPTEKDRMDTCECAYPILTRNGHGGGDTPVVFDEFMTCQICARTKPLPSKNEKI